MRNLLTSRPYKFWWKNPEGKALIVFTLLFLFAIAVMSIYVGIGQPGPVATIGYFGVIYGAMSKDAIIGLRRSRWWADTCYWFEQRMTYKDNGLGNGA